MKMRIMGFLIGGLVFLLLLPTVFAYDTYIGIKLTSSTGDLLHLIADYTKISITPNPGPAYDEYITSDADGYWTIDETVYTNLVSLTSGTEYTITIHGDGSIFDVPPAFIPSQKIVWNQCDDWCRCYFASAYQTATESPLHDQYGCYLDDSCSQHCYTTGHYWCTQCSCTYNPSFSCTLLA